MKQELKEITKQIVRVGNSAGVILPKEWVNGKARIQLIEEPIHIKQDILQILDPYLQDIFGVYIFGSYAREEQTNVSDIDVLVITNKTDKKIEKGKYNIILIRKEKVEYSLKDNIIPILPMIKEAKPLINSSLIENYKNTKLTRKNLKWYLGITKSSLNMNKSALELSEKENVSDNIMYSIILGLRGIYIVDCLIKNKQPTTKGLLSLLKKISGSIKPYESYLRSKNEKPTQRTIPIEQAQKIHSYAIEKIQQQEKWIKRKDKRK